MVTCKTVNKARIGDTRQYAALSTAVTTELRHEMIKHSSLRMCVQLDAASIGFSVTTKPVLSDHSK